MWTIELFGEYIRSLGYPFADFPSDKEECIEDNFYISPKGTDRYKIWHWFDESFPNRIQEMLYNRILKTNYA